MEKQKRIPRRRFREFLEAREWEERQLQDIADKSTEKNINSTYRETFTNSAEYGIINQRDFFDKDISNKENISAYFIVRPENFIYNPRISSSAPVGPINCNRLGRIGIMSPLYTVFSTKDIDNLFLEKYFQSRHWHKFMYFNGDTGARSDRFSIKDDVFFTMPISHPSHAEQAKIGDFCRRLDMLISLHQQKLSKLKDLKQAYLTEMFPAPGEKRPRRRFNGFSGDWEEYKLGDVVSEFYNGQTPSRSVSKYWNGDVNWLSSGELNRDIVTHTKEHLTEEGSTHLRMIPKGTFVIAVMGLEAVGVRGNCAILGIDTTINQACTAIFIKDDLIDVNFLKQWYQSIGNESGLKFTQGTKQQNYNAQILSYMDIVMPSLPEQVKIGEFLRCHDKWIRKENGIISKLLSLKQAYLSELFV